ncbi:type II toxin-antitoxin system antitoxin SocA domain-containing protein [Acrocarpospora sp. B8E8]|uniref:Panacea domain-containing protein n=1 Tax=Acrocarpospora sp. B8E8 TaxID=3153572 RepID=UPI00325DB86C
MATVLDVAAHILDRLGPMAAMKVHRLAWFSYGYHLVWEERRLFAEPFAAWANGPASPDLYAVHRGLLSLSPGSVPGDPGVLDDGERESVGVVLGELGDCDAHTLSLMTHQASPWVEARRRAAVGPLERSGELLLDAEIFEYFDALAAIGASAT